MIFEPLSDELAGAAVEALEQYGSKRAAASALGITRSTLSNRLKRASERGLGSHGFSPVMEGFRVSQVSTALDAEGSVKSQHIQQKPDMGEAFAVPAGHVVKGESALVDPDGRVIQKWVKTKQGEIDPATTVAAIKAAFDGYAPCAALTPTPAGASADLLTMLPCNDWHVGMHAWGREVGTDWDLKIAERVVGGAVAEAIDRSPSSGTFVVLGGGDLMHSDNNDNMTARSGNVLQVDGRYQKIMGVAGRLMVRTVELALVRHETVIVRILPGNHDEHASVAVAYFLSAWFRNEPRVIVDLDPGLFWRFTFGAVMLAATHGHETRIKQMPGVMAARWAKEWGSTLYRYAHGFHLHHNEKLSDEDGGAICEVHQAPIPQDSWHYGKGFLSGRSVQAITYHRQLGEYSRSKVIIADGEKVAA